MAEFDRAAVVFALPVAHGADHAGAAAGAKGDRLLRARRDDAALDAPCEHEAVRIGLQRENGLVHALQTGGRPLEITMVKREHESVAALRVEDAAEPVLQAPVILMGAFQKEARGLLRSACKEFLALFLSVEVCHGFAC